MLLQTWRVQGSAQSGSMHSTITSMVTAKHSPLQLRISLTADEAPRGRLRHTAEQPGSRPSLYQQVRGGASNTCHMTLGQGFALVCHVWLT